MADPVSAPAASGGGLPQLDVAQWPGQIVWMLVIFTVLYLLFARVFVPRVGGTIDEREDKIAGDIGEARRLRDSAQAAAAAAAGEIAEARARAQKLAADAHAEAKALATARQAQEEAKLRASLEEAEARIAVARAEAMTHVRAIAIDAAQAMITRLSGLPADRAEVERALAAPQTAQA